MYDYEAEKKILYGAYTRPVRIMYFFIFLIILPLPMKENLTKNIG